jgi:hypothetical protein
MIGKLKDFVKDNPGTSVLAGVAVLGMFMTFDGKQADLDAPEAAQRSPASEKKEKKKFFDLFGEEADDFDEVAQEFEETKAKKKDSAFARGNSNDAGSLGYSASNDTEYNPYQEIDSYNNQAAVTTDDGVDDFSEPTVEYTEEVETVEVTPYCVKYPYAAECTQAPAIPPEEFFPQPIVNQACGSVAVLPADGSYVTNPYITITGSDIKEIYYCFGKTGTPCDPTDPEVGQLYNGNIQISTTPGFQDNGTFTLSTYASCRDNKQTDVLTVTYVVDDTGVPISYFQTPIAQQLQTQEAQVMLETTSTAFGAPGYQHYTFNTGTFDPSAETCTDLAENLGFSLGSNAMRTIASVDVTDTTVLDPTNVIQVPLSPFRNPVMAYGDNFMVSFMQFTDGAGRINMAVLPIKCS